MLAESAVKQNCSTESSAVKQTCSTESSIKQTCFSNIESTRVQTGFSDRTCLTQQDRTSLVTESARVVTTVRHETSHTASTNLTSTESRETSSVKSAEYNRSDQSPESLRETSISPNLSGSVSPPLRQTSTPVSDSGYCSTWANQAVKEPLKSGPGSPTRVPNIESVGDNETSNTTPLSAPNISVGEHWNNRDIAGDEKFVKEVSSIRQTLESSLQSSSRQVSVESSRQISQPSSRQLSQPSSRQLSLESAEFDNDGSLRKDDDVISHDVITSDVVKKSKEPRLYHYLVDEDATSYQITSFSATSDSMGSVEDLLQRKISSELTHITPRSDHTEGGQEVESMHLAGEDGEEDEELQEEEEDDETSEDVSSTEVLMSIISKTMPSKEPTDESSTPRQQGNNSGDMEFERLYLETATALEMLSAAEEGEAFSESFREATLSYSEKYHRLSFSDERQEVRPLNPSPPSKSLFTDSSKEHEDDNDEITRTRLSLVMSSTSSHHVSSSSSSHHISTRVIGCSEYNPKRGAP
eukprot:sb/3463819/